MRYVLGIGTNVGDRKENIDKAIKAIELLPQTKIVLKSSIYETQPVDVYKRQVTVVSMSASSSSILFSSSLILI